MFKWRKKYRELLKSSLSEIASYRLANQQLEAKLRELEKKCKSQNRLIKELRSSEAKWKYSQKKKGNNSLDSYS